MLGHRPDHFEPNKVMLFLILNRFKIQELWTEMLIYLADHLKMQKICDYAVGKDLFSMQYISDWFFDVRSSKNMVMMIVVMVMRLLGV